MRTFISPLALVLLASAFSAKAACMSAFYVISGNVVQKDKSPAVGVAVGAAWQEFGTVGGPAMGITDAQGNYSITVEFKPYSPAPDGNWYECKLKLDSVKVSSYSQTHHSLTTSVPVTDGATEIQSHPIRVLEVKVDPLELLYAIDRPPFY